MGTVVSAPAPLSSPLWLLYSCLFWTVLFFLSRANRNIQTVSFFITSNPVSLCHQSPSPSRKVFDSQSSKSFVWEEKKVKNVISCSEKWRGGDPKYGLNEQMWSQHTFRAAEKYKQEREKKKRYMTNLCCGISANPCSVKCSHSEKHSCYHHPSTPATSLSSLHLGYSTNTVLALLS